MASSVTLRAAASTPPASRRAVYEPSGRVSARSAIVDHRFSSQAKPWVVARGAASSASKHDRVPRWQVGPAGSAVTSRASASQSVATSTQTSTNVPQFPIRGPRFALSVSQVALLRAPPRSFAERSYTNIQRWTPMERGGHFAAMEQPDALAREVREFFRPLRRGEARP